MIVPFESLVAFAREVLVTAGASREDAQEVARHLVRADASGRPSHGIRVLGEYVGTIKDGIVDPHARIEHVVDLGGVVVLDGRYGFGQATGRAALELAASRAAEHGVGCVLARRAGDIGRVGDYTERLADRSLASIMLVGGHAYGGRIAPWGGAEGRFPNDVISLGFPGGADPFVVDMALGAAALRRIRMAHERGEPIPDEWVITADGSPTTSPVDIDRGGRLLPAAGHKGYGLIVLVELLAGLLSGAGPPCRRVRRARQFVPADRDRRRPARAARRGGRAARRLPRLRQVESDPAGVRRRFVARRAIVGGPPAR